jgi:hypothetical protein
MPELLFYHQPTVLNKEVHKAIRFSPVKDFRFTNKVNSVPLLVIEFFESSRDLCSGQLIPDTTLSFSSARAGANPSLN